MLLTTSRATRSHKNNLTVTRPHRHKTLKTHMSKDVPKSMMTNERAVSCSCYSCFYSFKASRKLSITPAGKVCRFVPGEHKALLRDIALGKKRFLPSQSRAAHERIVMSAHTSKPAPGAFKAHLKRIALGKTVHNKVCKKYNVLGKGENVLSCKESPNWNMLPLPMKQRQ